MGAGMSRVCRYGRAANLWVSVSLGASRYHVRGSGCLGAYESLNPQPRRSAWGRFCRGTAVRVMAAKVWQTL